MYHLLETLTNDKGDSLVGYYVKLRDSSGAYATLASDTNGTPIINVSGVADAALSDEFGMVSLYVANGIYTLDVLGRDAATPLRSIPDMPMYGFAETTADIAALTVRVVALEAGGTPTPTPTVILTSPTGTQTGATSAALSVSTNEATGTLYWFVSTSATAPTASNLKDGTGAAKFGSQAVTTTGVQTSSIPTGLTASTTYYAHFLQRNAALSDSAIVSTATGFTTADAGALGSYTPNFYTNSATGSDANDGLTAPTAKQTLTAGEALLATGQTLALEGTFHETLLIDVDTTTIVGLGTVIPLVDGAGPVAETWVQDDAVTYPNTWSIDVTHGFVSNGRMMLWKNGAMLKRVESIALVNTTAASYYSPGDNLWSLSPTYKIYMNAAANPNSDGALYERTKHRLLVNCAYTGTEGVTVSRLVTGRQGDNDGSVVLGASSTLERVMAFDGHKHNALQESGNCRACVFLNAQPEVNYLHVFYAPAGGGVTSGYARNIFVGSLDGTRNTSAVYCHDNSGLAHEGLTLEGDCFANLSSAISSAAVTTNAVGCYFENVNSVFTEIVSSASELTHLLANKVYLRSSFSAAGAHAVRQSAFYLKNNSSFLQLSLASWGNILLQNVTLHMGDWDVTITSYDREIFTRTAGTGTCSAQNCVFLMDGTDTTIAPVLKLDTASIGTFNNNVYFYRGSFAKTSLKWQVDGTNLTFAQWQALGHDLNSVILDETDVTFANLMNGLPSAGDFRLKSGLALTLPDSTPISTLGVQEHWNHTTRAVAAGAPSVWPVMPKTYAEGLTYVGSPDAWAF